MRRTLSAAFAVPLVLVAAPLTLTTAAPEPAIAATRPAATRPAATGPAATGPAATVSVTATRETPAEFDDDAGGNADVDDPAIWVHPEDRGRSRVVVTAKQGGLRVYDLAGRQVQSITPPAPADPDAKPGRFNNVDLVSGFELGKHTADLAVVSDRGADKLRAYRIDPSSGQLTDVTASDIPYAFSRDQEQVDEQRTAYGLAAFSTDDEAYALVSRRSAAEVALFELKERGAKVGYKRVDSLRLPDTFRLPNGTTWSPCVDPGDGPQVEGIVVDVANEVAYLAQERVGLWRVPVEDGRFDGEPTLVAKTREFGVPGVFDTEQEECVLDYDADPGFGGPIAADVEGLTIHETGRRAGTLLVSSQGDSTFLRYDRRSNRLLGRFAVVAGPAADGSEHCDGAAVTSLPLPGFPGGLLVVQDGENTPGVDGGGEPRIGTDVKFVDAGFLQR